MRTILAVLLVLPAFAGDNLLRNGDFSKWRDGVPEGWAVEHGAGAPGGAPSDLRAAEGGGLRLSGDASTRSWRFVSQDVAVKPDGFYRLSFEARAAGLAQEEGQFDNAYGGLFAVDAAGKTTARLFETVRAADWAPHEILLARPGVATLRAAVFLSKTGRLEARGFVLEALEPGDSADVLLRQLARNYSYFDLKGIDPAALARAHRDRLTDAAEDPESFAAAAAAMLAELKDPHVHVVKADGTRLETCRRTWTPNFDFKWVAKQLAGVVQIGKVAFAGTTAEGFGYVAIGSLVYDDATAAKIAAEIEARLEAPAFIIDLRGNAGGNELRAQALAAIFADRERVYAKARFRSGPKPSDLSEPAERRIAPRAGKTFTKPVVVLTGPGCVSSGEGFVKALKSLPHATLVGLPTAGASGNPAPVELPNGVTVALSRWVDLLPDGTPTEGKGIAPDVEVAPGGEGDAAFVKALEILREKTKR